MQIQRALSSLVILSSMAIAASAQCPPGNLAFGSQSQIDGFAAANPGCTEVLGEVTIQGSSITNLEGLAQIEQFSGGLGISNCPSLTSLTGLENVTSIDYLQIVNCDALTDLSGFDGLTNITGFVQIKQNAMLIDFTGMEALQSIGDFVQIDNNDLLSDFTGWNGLTGINSFVQVQNNPQLESLAGLDALESLDGYLQFNSNPVLTDLSGLSALQTISGFLQISGNTSLTSLHGLEGLDPTSFSLLTLINCPLLSQCAIECVCTYLDGTGQRAISGNASGCSSVAEVQTECLSIGLEESTANALTLFPNPAHDEIRLIGLDGTTSVEIHDAIGALVARGTLSSTGYLDLHDLAPGPYALMVVEKGSRRRLPFILQ